MIKLYIFHCWMIIYHISIISSENIFFLRSFFYTSSYSLLVDSRTSAQVLVIFIVFFFARERIRLIYLGMMIAPRYIVCRTHMINLVFSTSILVNICAPILFFPSFAVFLSSVFDYCFCCWCCWWWSSHILLFFPLILLIFAPRIAINIITTNTSRTKHEIHWEKISTVNQIEERYSKQRQWRWWWRK